MFYLTTTSYIGIDPVKKNGNKTEPMQTRPPITVKIIYFNILLVLKS